MHNIFQEIYTLRVLCCILLWFVTSRFNTLRPRQNGRHFADDIFTCIFLNENAWIPIIISLKFVPKGPINNIPALVLIMAWRRPGDKPLSEPMMVILKTHICVTWPQCIYASLGPNAWGSPILWLARIHETTPMPEQRKLPRRMEVDVSLKSTNNCWYKRNKRQ